MSNDQRANIRTLESKLNYVKRSKLEDYTSKYADYFHIQRDNGIVEVRMHTGERSAMFSVGLHNAWTQLWLDIGNDPDNEVLIFTGTGDQWIVGPDFSEASAEAEDNDVLPPDAFFEQGFIDATKLLECFVFNIDIPTIACLNGPGLHTEFALLCDITLAAEHAELFDPHFGWHLVPGDGQALTFQELMGPKRAAYYMYTSEAIPAQAAKEMGLVNEVLPTEQLIARARKIAQIILEKPRHVRRLTSAIVRRPWKRRLVEDLGFHVAHEMLGIRLST